MGKNLIFQSKVIPPILPHTYMARANLVKKMQHMDLHKLTIVQGDAGFGKSLGLVQYFYNSQKKYAWYTVTEEDDDIIPFMTYLKHSIQRVLPSFGDSLGSVDMVPDSFFKEEDLEQWLALLINELCDVEDKLFIVIDDYYLVDHVFEINYFMEKLIRLIPSHIHIVISSRMKLKWSILPKLNLEGQLFVIDERNFIFSSEEVKIFLEDYLEEEVTEATAATIMEFTEGWAIAINMVALNFDTLTKDLEGNKRLDLSDLFDYLSEEVFQQRNEEEQKALLQFAIFPTFSEALIADFYDAETSELLTTQLLDLGFIQYLEEKSYRYHALFKQFLHNKWLQTNREMYTTLHRQAAVYFKRNENYLQSTYHAVQANDPLFIGEILAASGKSLIESGQFDRYLDAYTSLDTAVKEKYYALYFFEGEAQRYRAFYEKARQAYEKCLILAKREGDNYFLSRANAGMTHIFLDTIQPSLAEPYLIKAIDYSKQSNKMPEKERSMLKRQYAENLVNLGKASEASAWVETEKLADVILAHGNLDARIYLRTGEIQQGIDVLMERLEADELPDSHRQTDVLLSFMYGMMGEVELALLYGEKGIKTGRKLQSKFIEAVGYTRAAHASMHGTTLDLQKAEGYYSKAILLMDDLHVERGKVEPLMGLSMLKLRMKDEKNALAYGIQALRESERVQDKWMSGLVYVCLAISHYYFDNISGALKHIQLAKKIFEKCGDSFGVLIATFWAGVIYDKMGKEREAVEQIEQFASTLVQKEYGFFLKKDTIFSPIDREIIFPFFQKMLSHETVSTEVSTVIKDLDIVASTHYPGYHIHVSILGTFQIYLGLREVSEDVWKREKAKELLLFLLLHRDRFVDKEEIKQALWPDKADKTADQLLKVTLNAMLKVIEPHREARRSSFFVQRKNTMYRLNTRAKITTDLDNFKAYINAGKKETDPEKAIALLQRGMRLYRQDPFEMFHRVDWLMQRETEIETAYIEAVDQLVKNYLKLKQYEDVIAWAKHLRQKNVTWEAAYRYLMIAYYQLKNRPQSIQWYQTCEKVLEEELNIPPMDETVQMYEAIRANGEIVGF